MKLTSPPGPGTDKAVGRSGRLRQLAWASVPLWSLGFLAFAPFFYLAITRRRLRDWAVFAAYLAVAAAFFTYIVRSNGGHHPAAGRLLVLFVGIAVMHVFIAFRPGSAPAPWRDVHARAGPSGLGAGQKVVDRSGRLRQLGWASVPLWSFGFLAYAPFLYLAVIRRRVRDWAVFAAYLAALVILVVTAGSKGTPGGGLFLLLMGVAAVHALIAFRPGSAPAPWRDVHARAGPSGLGAGQKVVDRSGRLRQLGWASVPLWSFGFLAFAPFLYLAVIRRRVRDWAVFAAYLAAFTSVITAYYARGSNGALSRAAGLYVLFYVLFIGLAAMHVFIVLRPGGSFPAPWRDVHAARLVTADPAVHPGLAFVVVDGPCAGTAVAWNHAEIVLGRGAEGSELFDCDPAVSQRHVIVRCGLEGACVVEETESAAGTLVNGVRIDGPTELRPGDELAVGRTRLRVTSIMPDPASVVAREAAPGVNGPSGIPYEPEPSLDLPEVLRVDHVELWQGHYGTWKKTEAGWLILTATGEVRFYKRLPSDMTAAPDLSAPSTAEFAQEIWDGGLRAHFGEQERSVVFTGTKPPAISPEKLEQAGGIADSIATIGDTFSDQSLSQIGDTASLTLSTLKFIGAIRARRRSLAVMRVWYPVLLGERPLSTIDVIDAGLPANSEQAQDQEFLRELADLLAVGVAAQWEAEAAMRSLNDPYPLPVRWDAADASLADEWGVLVRLARSGADWPVPPPPGTWAAGPGGLAGDGNHLVNVLSRVPTGRMVVLGEPGAGKTMLMVQLVQDLLAARASGDPVPVLASLASWNPARQDLHGWLAAQLTVDHPALAAAALHAPGKYTLMAELLLSAGLILPILDGLDEIPEEVRGSAITRINDSLRPGEHLILTCRSEPYREAIHPPEGVKLTVQAAAVVQLRPLDRDAVSRYLCYGAGNLSAAARWDPVLAALGTQAPVGQALVTPLMVGVASAIYNPRPGEPAEEMRDPAELCGMADRAAVESHLLDGFIPAAYRSGLVGRWEARQAETWLVFLACHLENVVQCPDLAWWELLKAGPFASLNLAAGLAAGLAASVAAGLVTGLAAGLWAGLAAGFVFGLGGAVGSAVVARQKNPRPSKSVRFDVFAVRYAAVLVAAVAIGTAIAAPIALSFGSWFGTAAGLLFGGVTGWFIFRLWPSSADMLLSDLPKAASPRAVLVRDRRAAFDTAVVAGFGFVCLFGIVVGIVAGFVVGLVPGLVFGLAFPAYLGLYSSQTRTAWPSYLLVRGWLALHHRLPWALMDFLVDAHQRGVLRQTGSVYQFRHIELERRLATRPRPPADAL